MNACFDSLKVHFATSCLDEKDNKLYWLIDRYKDKASKRLLDIQSDLFKKGDNEHRKIRIELFRGPNEFLDFHKNTNVSTNKYIPVPISYKHI